MRHLLLLLLTVPAFAKEPEPVREVKLRLVAFDPIVPEKMASRKCLIADAAAIHPGAGAPAEIKKVLDANPKEIRLKGNDLLFLESAEAKDPERPGIPLPKVTLPNAGDRFIVIFLPPVAPGVECRVVTVDDSGKEFPAGSYRVVNQSSAPVKLTLEGKAFEIKAGGNALIENPPANEKKMSVMYAYRLEGGKWQRVGAGLWPHPGKKRSVQVFWDNAVTGRTELKGFRDVEAGK